MKRQHFARLACTTFLCLLPKAVLAQATETQPSEGETVTVTARARSGLDLGTPSMAGSRLALTPLETPASVSVLNGDLLRNLSITSVADAQTLAPGIANNSSPGSGGIALSSRGFYGANSVAQLYDGVQLFNAGSVVAFPVDPWNVDRIEFLAGPATTLYGVGAIGGAFNVVTKKPNPTTFGLAGQASFGSFGEYHAAVDVTGPLTDKLAFRVNASGLTSQGWVPRATSDSIAVSASLRWAPVSGLVVTLSDDYGDVHPSTYEGTPVVANAIQTQLRFQNYNIYDATIDFQQNIARLRAEWSPNSHVAFIDDAYLIDQWRNYNESYTYSYSPATNLVRRTNFRDIHAFQKQYGDHGYATLKLQPFGLENDTDVGFDVNRSVYDRYDNSTASGYTGSSYVDPFTFLPGPFFQTGNGAIGAKHQYLLTLDEYGFFAEDRLKLASFLSVTGGVRHDHYGNSRVDYVTNTTYKGDYNSTGWNVGAVLSPTATTSIYAQYAKAEDPVTSLASVSAAQIAFGLSPARQIEVGAKASLWQGKVEATIAAYDIVKKNLLTPSLANPTVSEQVGRQSSHGLEASLALHPVPSLLLQANGTVLRARFDTYLASLSGKLVSLAGYRPQLVPTRTANVVALWSFLPAFQVRARLSYEGDRYTDNTNLYRLAPYTLVDIGLRWSLSRHVNLDVAVNNLTDAIYVAGVSAGASTPYILGEPRNVRGTVNFSF